MASAYQRPDADQMLDDLKAAGRLRGGRPAATSRAQKDKTQTYGPARKKKKKEKNSTATICFPFRRYQIVNIQLQWKLFFFRRTDLRISTFRACEVMSSLSRRSLPFNYRRAIKAPFFTAVPTCPALGFLPAATRRIPCDHSQAYHFSLALWAAFGAIKEFLSIVEHMMDCCATAESLPELPTTDMSWIVMTQNKTPLAA